MLKYKLTDETKEWNGHTLHKIEYTKEWLESMELEELEGGWIESEKNLAQGGDARVYGNAWVYGNAQVFGNARVYGNARVFGNAWVYGNAQVSQGTTTAMRITATEQWFEYQHVIAELQKKWDKEERK